MFWEDEETALCKFEEQVEELRFV